MRHIHPSLEAWNGVEDDLVISPSPLVSSCDALSGAYVSEICLSYSVINIRKLADAEAKSSVERNSSLFNLNDDHFIGA